MTSPTPPDSTRLLSTLVVIGTESWRLLRTVERFASALDADQQRRIIGRITYFERKLRDELEAVGLRMVDYTGQPFGPELAATAVNADEISSDDYPVVEQTLEPAILGPEGVLKVGTVTLRKGSP